MNTRPPPKKPLDTPEEDDDAVGAAGGGGRADGGASGDSLEGLTLGLHQGFPSDLSIDRADYAAVLRFLGRWVNPLTADALYNNGLGAELAWQAQIEKLAAGWREGLHPDDPLLAAFPLDVGDVGDVVDDDEQDAVDAVRVCCDEGETHLHLPPAFALRHVEAQRTLSVAQIHAEFDALDAAATSLIHHSVRMRG